MPAGDVLRLEEYRDRRLSRLRLGEALNRADPRRHSVFRHLVESAELFGADRAAVVWIDEHGSGMVHPYVVVDHLSSRPRRSFSFEPLRGALQLGVPGAYQATGDSSTAAPATFAVALGSDGTRAWFLVAESLVPRPETISGVRDRLMFLAGECAGVVLHRDLDVTRRSDRGGAGGRRFAGWEILADLDGREADELESRRIAQRFVVLRLVRLLVDDELTTLKERSAEQVRRARAEVAHDTGVGAEFELWHRTLDALEGERFDDLAMLLVDLGDVVEGMGHTHGAVEIYDCAFSIASALGAARPAAMAARLRGRALRRRANWAEAQHHFGVARDIAEAAGFDDLLAQSLVGSAGVAKETGNLPAARKLFQEALMWAERSTDRETIAFVHHGLLGLEQAAGNLAAGIRHGWVAVALYQGNTTRLRTLASLAGVLIDYGDYEAAEDAWSVVAASSDEEYYRIFAHDALAHLAALRGDRAAFDAQVRRCDALDWESGPSSAKVQILYYRGISHQALGDLRSARSWLSRAVAFAEEHRYNQILFQAEEALKSLDSAPSVSEKEAVGDTAPAAPSEVREGLRAMRQEVVGIGK